MPPSNPFWTKTRIFVIMINTCHCVIVFLLGFYMWAYKGEMQYNFAFCVGQSCDGAAAMASERSGVTSIVQHKSSFGYYFYCATHCLNLSATAAVTVSAIQNANNVARKVVKMFKASGKKTALLKSCIKEDVSSQGETKRYIVCLCEIRFVRRRISIPVKHSKLEAKNFNKVCLKSV